jgi:hypothetical protein
MHPPEKQSSGPREGTAALNKTKQTRPIVKEDLCADGLPPWIDGNELIALAFPRRKRKSRKGGRSCR